MPEGLNISQLKSIRHLVAQDELPAAFEQMKALSEDPKFQEAVLLESDQYFALVKDITRGHLTVEEAIASKRQISSNLLDLLQDIQKEGDVLPNDTGANASNHNSNVFTASGISVGGDLYLNNGNYNSQGTKRKVNVRFILVIIAALGVGLFTLLFASGYFQTSATITASILVKERNKPPDRQGEIVGELTLIYGDQLHSKPIPQNGEVTFKRLPADLVSMGEGVSIKFQDGSGKGYQAVHPDSSYILHEGLFTVIEVELEGLDMAKGMVRSMDGPEIQGAIIRISGIEAETNRYGEFELPIPAGKRKVYQEIEIHAEGFQDQELREVPISSRDQMVIMMAPL